MKLPDNPLAKCDNEQKPLYVVPFHTWREAKISALEVADILQLRFDKRRFMLHFPAFDLKFTSSKSNPQLHGYRNVIDVAELDELLLGYKERKETDNE